MKQYEVGDTFNFKEVELLVVESDSCENCFFANCHGYCFADNPQCAWFERDDKKEVKFGLSGIFYEVGDIFSYTGVKLKVVEDKECEGCYFENRIECVTNKFFCTQASRIDDTEVKFVEV